MPPRPLRRPDQKTAERQIEVTLPFRIPPNVSLNESAHQDWLRMLTRAETLVQDDQELQYKVSKGLRMKGRPLPPEVLGRLYAQYCALINKMHEAYLLSVQLQRAVYMKEIITIIMKRMFELRNELVHIIVNDYIYVDAALLQLGMTPFDIQIVVPYHYPVDTRPDSMEQLLQKMWADAIRRKNRKLRPPKPKNSKSKSQAAMEAMFDDDAETENNARREPEVEKTGEEEEEHHQDEEEVEEEEEEEVKAASEHTIITEDYINSVLLQRHERFRQFAYRHFLQKCFTYRKFFAGQTVEPAPELKHKAAVMIQKFYRRYMQVKRQRVIDHKRDILLGIVPDVDRRPLKHREELNKLYEKRRITRQKIDKKYQEQIEKERTKLLYVKKGDQIEDITDDIIQWFAEWYYGYGFFPQYPYELEGGTILVVTGQYETIEERQADDERLKATTKGKTKDQLKQERAQAKQDAILKRELELEKIKKEKLALFKARCNPSTDPGYEPKMSECTWEMYDVLRKYRQAWSIYDSFPVNQCADIIYGYMNSVIREDLMCEIGLECRKFVDELMRLELKLFVKAQQEMFKRVEWKFPKPRLRKRPKPPKEPKPFIVDDDMTKSVREVFDLGIMSRPTVKLDDVMGDLKYGVYEQNVTDPIAKFPSPGYGDVKRRIALSCVFGSGVEPGAPRNKTVLLLGLPRNGKTFLADAVAGELGAVKFDISPEVFSAVVKKPAKKLQLVFTAARMFQPSVIFLKNIEKLFYKKVPPNEKREKARVLKKPLMKLLKAFPSDGQVIFIATCSNPFASKVRPMMKMFNEIILIPKPDYGSLQRFFYESFQKIRSMPRDFCVQGLAKCLQGFGFGFIIELFDTIMNPERITKLCENPLNPSEFVEYLIVNNIEPTTEQEYQKFVDLHLQYSPLKQERAEYAIINETREYAYEKLKKKQEDDEKKRAEKAGKK